MIKRSKLHEANLKQIAFYKNTIFKPVEATQKIPPTPDCDPHPATLYLQKLCKPTTELTRHRMWYMDFVRRIVVDFFMSNYPW